MKGELVYRKKETLEGYIREMVVRRLYRPVPGCRHLFKYRFFFGTDTGTCLVRYHNERGKGDHKHLKGAEIPYLFRSLETTFSDFLADVSAAMEERSVE